MINTPTKVQKRGKSLQDKVSDTQEKIEQLAKKLRKSHPEIAQYLEELHDVLLHNDPNDIEEWLEIDLQQLINAEAVTEGTKARAVPGGFLRGLELARNVLIFLPIMWTWLSISQATSSYTALISADTTHQYVGLPFLYLWQQGFNGTLPQIFRLSDVAFWDVLFLIGIILLTVIVNGRLNFKHMQLEKEADALREEISRALGDAHICLRLLQRHHQISAPPKDLEAAVRQMSTFTADFKKVMGEVLQEMEDERKQRGSLQAFMEAMEHATRDILAATGTVKQTNNDLLTAVKGIETPIKAIPDLVQAAGKAIAALEAMNEATRKLVTDQQQSFRDLTGYIQTTLGTISDDQKAGLQRIQQVIQDFADNMSTQQQEAAEQIQSILKDMASQQTSMKDAILSAVDDVQDAVQQFGESQKKVQQGLQQQNDILDAINQQLQNHQQVVANIQEAAKNIYELTRDTREAIPELQSIAASSHKLVGALKDIPEVLEKELLQPLKHYSGAAANIEDGSRLLGKAATALDAVADRLNGVK